MVKFNYKEYLESGKLKYVVAISLLLVISIVVALNMFSVVQKNKDYSAMLSIYNKMEVNEDSSNDWSHFDFLGVWVNETDDAQRTLYVREDGNLDDALTYQDGEEVYTGILHGVWEVDGINESSFAGFIIDSTNGKVMNCSFSYDSDNDVLYGYNVNYQEELVFTRSIEGGGDTQVIQQEEEQ